MLYYAAPMEGITSYIWRNAHHHYYPGIDKYFTPFLTPKKGKGWTAREKSEIFPDHNKEIPLVPQILTNCSQDFVHTVHKLAALGYQEVNLNLGCPSGTVVSKGKGSGFLKDPETLKRFFDQIFNEEGELPAKISVKTRLGMEKEEELFTLMDIYNQFPLHEIIIHARLQKDMYRGTVRKKAFREAFSLCRHPVCYNGDIFTEEDREDLIRDFPDVPGVMLARGLVGNPQLQDMILHHSKKDIRKLKLFHDEVCAGYEEIMSGDRNVLFKMKELWSYMLPEFPGSEKHGKKIRKSVRLTEYKYVTEELFSSIEERTLQVDRVGGR